MVWMIVVLLVMRVMLVDRVGDVEDDMSTKAPYGSAQ
jgi:hypothetical protein